MSKFNAKKETFLLLEQLKKSDRVTLQIAVSVKNYRLLIEK